MTRSLAFGMTLVWGFIFLAPVRSTAAPGDLDLGFGGFGEGGKIQNLGINAKAMVIDAQGRLVLVGNDGHTFFVQRRSGPRFATVESFSIVIDSGQQGAGAHAVAIAPDGKIVVAGSVIYANGQHDFAIVRLNPDLTPDATFADDAVQSSDFNGGDDDAYGVAVQADNKIVTVGSAFIQHTLFDDLDFAAERFNDDGTLDRGFGNNGKWTADIQQYDTARAVVLQDDKILVVGDSRDAAVGGSDYDFVLARLNANGGLDGGFGDGGVRQTGFGADELAYGVALAPSGKIVMAGSISTGDIALARYSPNGTLDETFGSHGRVTTGPATGVASAFGVVVQPDERIVVAGGNAMNGPGQFILARYDPDGTPDATFGVGGQVVTSFGGADSGAAALGLQSDGMVIAVGGARSARYRWDGELDAGGIVDVVFDPTRVSSTATALAVQNDGKLVAAGEVGSPGDYDIALARFTADRHGLDPTFGTDSPPAGRTLYGLAGADEDVQGLALQAGRKAVVVGTFHTAVRGSSVLAGRFNADGTPDLGCAGMGFTHLVVGTVDGTGRAADAGHAVALGPDNKIYLAGTARGPTDSDYGLGRLKEDCSLDRADALELEDYRFRFDLGGTEDLKGTLLQGAKVVLAGTSGHDIVLVRFGLNRSGLQMELDQSFGVNGRAILDTGFNDIAAGVAQQANGKLIVAGTVDRGGDTGSERDFLVARFTPDGVLDRTFGDNGFAVADVGAGDTASGLAVRDDDTIALAGRTDGRFAVAQFTPSGHLDTNFAGNGKVTLRLGPDGVDEARAVTFLGRNHLVVSGSSQVFGKLQFALASFETTRKGPVPCAGDCNSNGVVTVDELLTMVNIALSNVGVSACEAGDANRNGQVSIDELLSAVNAALIGCPT